MNAQPQVTKRLAEVRRLYASGEASQIRQSRDITAAEFARGVGVSRATVTLWENGRRTPTGERALRALAMLQALRGGRDA